MFCQKCGAENSETAKFCKNCGNQFGQLNRNKWNILRSKNKIKILSIAFVVLLGLGFIFFARDLTVGERIIKRSFTNQNGAIVDYDMAFPYLKGRSEGVDVINEHFKQHEQDYLAYKDSGYLSNESVGGDHFIFTMKLRKEAMLGDIISFGGEGISSAGGVGNSQFYGDVFDLNTGRKLGFDDLFNVSEATYLARIFEEVERQIKESIDNNTASYSFGSLDNPEVYAVIRTQYDSNNFYLTDKALVIVYPQYSLGVGADGAFKFEIPFDKLADILKIKTGINL